MGVGYVACSNLQDEGRRRRRGAGDFEKGVVLFFLEGELRCGGMGGKGMMERSD